MANFSNTKAFNLPIDDIILEATERVGGKWDSAEEADSAIRSLNLVFTDLLNRGKPLYTVKQKSFPVLASVASYTLSVGTMQILGPVLRVSSADSNGPTDYPINRIGFLDFNNISRKETMGRPTLYTVEQQRDNILVRLWPTPVSTGDDFSIIYYGYVAPDTVTELFQNPDASRRYYSVLVDGLSFYMSLKRPEITMDRMNMFKQKFEESVTIAFGEDREQVSHIVYPATGWYNVY